MTMEQTNELYQICSQELDHLQENIANFRRCSAHILAKVSAHWQEIDYNRNAFAVIAYENLRTSMTNIMELSRKFSVHLELNELDKTMNMLNRAFEGQNDISHTPSNQQISNSRADLATSAPCLRTEKEKVESSSTQAAQYNDYVNRSLLPAEENDDPDIADTEALDPNLEYSNTDLSKYHPGQLIQASVTYIQDLKTLKFFILDLANPDLAQVSELSQLLYMRQYVCLPPENEVFGLVLENKILRAVREKSLEFASDTLEKKCSHFVLLLDFGEVVEVTASDIMYHLSPNHRKLPAQAILCQLLNISGKNDATAKELQKCLEDVVYKKVKFIVKKVENKMLHLQLISEDDIAAFTKNKNKNPFLPTLPERENPQEHEESAFNTNDEVVSFSASPSANNVNKLLPNGLSAEQVEILFEEPHSTTNAMKAVMGYDPQDDKRICKFYDYTKNTCFKGASCRQEHVLPQREGWTKDILPSATIIENRVDMVCYPKNTVINITPTYVENVDRFYALINDPKKPIIPLIWNSEDIPEFKRLKSLPYVLEIVLAKYEDGHYYRAKVIETDEASQYATVFYVDYGNTNCVHLSDLARCDKEVLHFPFQAVLCRLADIRAISHTPEQRQRAIDMLCNYILNKSMNVEVQSDYEDLMVRFVDPSFASVPKTLIHMKYVVPVKSTV